MKQQVHSAGRFSVMIASDEDHEEVYVEIYYDDKFVALVSQEYGLEHKMLEVPGPGLVEEQISRKVDLEGFQQALELAARKLHGE